MIPARIFAQIFLFVLFVSFTNAETNCIDSVNNLKIKINTISFNGGMWGYFEKNPELRKQSSEAIQLDSSINKIFFALDHLCLTEKGIPLNDLATYISRNLSVKSKSQFKSELLLIGKTQKQIDIWFQFHLYAQSHKFRTLKISKIKKAVNQSALMINAYIQLADEISRGTSPQETLNKTKSLNNRINQLLVKQPYLVKAIEEISQVPFWDTNESTGGS